ncbi:MAG: D-alanine--D-alanine ligase [Phycisphaerales bacterium]|nr:D-alanine--D-alanine ligase [Phycisphaerales bacterium]
MKITVLYGGPSAEREISLISGKAVAAGLRDAGHTVFESDIQPDDLSALNHSCEVVFPVLHGNWGESGELQEILEQRGLKFVGSGSHASRLGMDKVATKRAWEAAGLPTPPYRVISTVDELDASMPCVIKTIDGGSSIDVYVFKELVGNDPAPVEAARRIISQYGRALVEQFINGPELTVGLLEEKPLAPIRIVPKRGFFDYQAKYQATDTEHRFETGLPAELVARCQQLSQRAGEVIGARDLARVDIMIDQQTGAPYLLEINTLPGFTSKSLLPEAAARGGISFSQLVDRLARRAAARDVSKPVKTTA